MFPNFALRLRGLRSVALVTFLAACGRTSAPDPKAQAEGLYLQGTARYLQGDFHGAKEAFAQVRKLTPKDPRLSAALGEVHLAEGKPAEAARAFEEATRVDPSRALNWSRYGQSLLLQGKREEAAVALNRAVELEPADAGALEQLGELAQKGGRFEEAVRFYTRAAQASEGDPRIRRWLLATRLLSEKGRVTDAIALLAEAVANGAAGRELYAELGDLHVRRGALQAAEAAYREGAMQGDALLWETVAEIAQKQGRLAEAENAFRQSLFVRERALPHIGLGHLYLRRGDKAAAENELKQALALADGVSTHESRELADLLAALGRHRDALRLLESLALDPEQAKDVTLKKKIAQLTRKLRGRQGRNAP